MRESADWASSIGSKACGGPTGFVAYSLKLNTTEFLTKLKNTQIIRKIQYEMGLFQLVTFLLPNKYRMCEWKVQLIY
jgi:hypothetical protein